MPSFFQTCSRICYITWTPRCLWNESEQSNSWSSEIRPLADEVKLIIKRERLLGHWCGNGTGRSHSGLEGGHHSARLCWEAACLTANQLIQSQLCSFGRCCLNWNIGDKVSKTLHCWASQSLTLKPLFWLFAICMQTVRTCSFSVNALEAFIDRLNQEVRWLSDLLTFVELVIATAGPFLSC